VPEFAFGELVERKVSADDGECFGIFSETLLFEAPAGKAAPDKIAFGRVNLPEPAWVFPRTGSHKEPLCCQGAELLLQLRFWFGFRFVEERKVFGHRGRLAISSKLSPNQLRAKRYFRAIRNSAAKLSFAMAKLTGKVAKITRAVTIIEKLLIRCT
jgi:hypothetical protein